MFEFGAPGLYNADPWNKAMVVNGNPAGDPAAHRGIAYRDDSAHYRNIYAHPSRS